MRHKRIEGTRQERVEKIVDVARKLFDEKGYHAVTMREIASEVHMSPGLIYRYHESKGHILADILAAYVAEQAAALHALPAPEGPALDRLMHYLRAMYRFDLERLSLRRLAATESWAWDRKMEQRFFVEVLDIFEPVMASLHGIGVSLDEEARWAIWAIYTEALRLSEYEAEFARPSSEGAADKRRPVDPAKEIDRFDAWIRPKARLILRGLGAD